MRIRIFTLAAVIGLVTACADGGGSSTTAPPDAETSTTVGDAPEEVLLSYSLAAGDTFVYAVEVVQNIDMTSEGEGAAFAEGEGEDLPASAAIEMTATGTFTFEVADGPEPGTYEVTITSDFTDVTATGTVDGAPLPADEAPDFAEIEPVSVTVVVDERGNVIPESSDLDDPLTGMLGGMGSLAPGSMPGTQLGQFFGPPFADEGVTVGDTWSTTFDTPGLTAEPITTSVTSTVTGTDSIDGIEVLVVESETVVDAFEFDLGEFFIGLFTGFVPDDATEEEKAELDALVENLRFVMSFDDSRSDSTTLFDPEAGLTRRFEVTSSSTIGMDVNFPDEVTGEMSGFVMEMGIQQAVTHTLVSGPSA